MNLKFMEIQDSSSAQKLWFTNHGSPKIHHEQMSISWFKSTFVSGGAAGKNKFGPCFNIVTSSETFNRVSSVYMKFLHHQLSSIPKRGSKLPSFLICTFVYTVVPLELFISFIVLFLERKNVCLVCVGRFNFHL